MVDVMTRVGDGHQKVCAPRTAKLHYPRDPDD
jgi:hypothetical protein